MNTKKLICTLLSVTLTFIQLTIYAQSTQNDAEFFEADSPIIYESDLVSEVNTVDKTSALQAWIQEFGITIADINNLLTIWQPSELSLELRRLNDFRTYNQLADDTYEAIKAEFLQGNKMAVIEENYITTQLNSINSEEITEEKVEDTDIPSLVEPEQIKESDSQNNEENTTDAEEIKGTVAKNLESDIPSPATNEPEKETQLDVLAMQSQEEPLENETISTDASQSEQVEHSAEQNEFRQQYMQNKEAFYAQKAHENIEEDNVTSPVSNDDLISELYTQEEYNALSAQCPDTELLNINLVNLAVAFGSIEEFDFGVIKNAYLNGAYPDSLIGAKIAFEQQGNTNYSAQDIVSFVNENPTYMPEGYQLMSTSSNSPTLEDMKSYYKQGFRDNSFSNDTIQEIIDTATLGLRYEITDYSLAGRNGMDLTLGRIYSSQMAAHSFSFSDYYGIHYGMSELYSPLGVGWRFNVPEINSNVLYMEDGRCLTYKKDYSTGNEYVFQNHKVNDIAMEDDSSVPGASVKVTEKDGMTYYFTSMGHIVKKSDRFGNSIYYTYNETVYPAKLTKIYDDFNRSININYTTDNQGNSVITATLPDGNNIIYNTTAVQHFGNSYKNPVLSSVADQLNRTTTYTYTPDSVNVGGGPATPMYFENLTEITSFTGAKTRYTYAKGFGNTNKNFFAEYFYVSSRYEYDGVNELNKINYYTTIPGTTTQLNNYTGYPQYTGNTDDMPDTIYIQTYSKVEKQQNAKVIRYTYNNKLRLSSSLESIDGTRISSGEGYMYTMYAYNNQELVSAMMYRPGSDSGCSTTTSFTYDDKGNTLSTVSNNKSVTYTYDETYSLPLTITTKKDENTYHKTTNVLSEDKKSIIKTTKSQIKNGVEEKPQVSNVLYDVYGNVLSTSRTLTQNANDAIISNVIEYDNNGLYMIKQYMLRTESGNLQKYGEVELQYNQNTGLLVRQIQGDVQYSYMYDAVGRLNNETIVYGVSSISPQTCIHSIHYDDNARIITYFPCEGHTQSEPTTKTYYDIFGREIKHQIQGEDNTQWITTEELTYTKDGNIETSKDAEGFVTTYYYDSYNEIVKQQYSSGYTIETDYDYETVSYGQHYNKIVTTQDSMGANTISKFDENGNLVKKTMKVDDNTNIVNTYQYDIGNRLISQTGEETMSYTYDAFDNRLSIQQADVIQSFEYNNFNDVIKESHKGGLAYATEWTQYEYLMPAVVSKITKNNRGNATQEWTYDENLQKTSFKDFSGTLTNYTYNKYLLLSGATCTRDGITYGNTYEYSPHQLLTKNTDVATGNYFAYQHNSLGQIKQIDKKINNNILSITDMTYNNSGKLLSFTDERNKTTRYTYNSYGWIISAQNPNVGSINYFYYQDGSVSKKMYGFMTTEYQLYANKAVKEIKLYNFITNSSENPNILLNYTYNESGNITNESIASGNNSVINTHTYDDYNRIHTTNTVKTQQEETISSVTETTSYFTGTNNIYSFSLKNNLTGVTESETYSYIYRNEVDNRLVTGSNTKNERCLYNNDNCMTAVTDWNNGNNIHKSYEYDVFKRLTKYYNGSKTDENLVASYEYDPEGFRSIKTVDGITTVYQTFNQTVLNEYTLNEDGSLEYTAGNLIVGNSIEGRVINNIPTHFLKNAHGDVIAATSTNQILQTKTYSQWGNEESDSQNADTLINPIGYAGAYYDAETNFIYLGARYYDLTTKRFTSEDPLQLGANYFMYCDNNPVNRVDPNGKEPVFLRTYVEMFGGTVIYNDVNGSVTIKYQDKIIHYDKEQLYMTSDGRYMIDSSTIYGDLNNSSNANPGNKLVNIAKGELGNREVGDTNINKYGEWYGNNGVPWCAQFVSWCANEAGILGTVVPKYQSCYAGMQWYAARGRLHYVKDNYQPMRGDVFFKSSNQYPNGGGHTGIVTGYDPYNGMVYTIEGNSGNRVCYNKRHISEFYAFGDNYGDQFGPPNPNAEPGGSVV